VSRLSGSGSDFRLEPFDLSRSSTPSSLGRAFSCKRSVVFPDLWTFSALIMALHAPPGIPGDRKDALAFQVKDAEMIFTGTWHEETVAMDEDKC